MYSFWSMSSNVYISLHSPKVFVFILDNNICHLYSRPVLTPISLASEGSDNRNKPPVPFLYMFSCESSDLVVRRALISWNTIWIAHYKEAARQGSVCARIQATIIPPVADELVLWWREILGKTTLILGYLKAVTSNGLVNYPFS